MKKLILGLCATIGIISLAGCKSESTESYDLDETAKSTTLATEWLNNVSYNGTSVNNSDITGDEGYNSKGTKHYEVYLPEDVKNSIRLNVGDVSSYDEYSSVYVNYASTSSLSDSDYSVIIDILASDDSIMNSTTFEVFNDMSTEIEASDDFLEAEKDTKKVAVLYLPVFVKYVKYKSDNSTYVRYETLHTYVLVPVYASLTTYSNCSYNDSVVENYKDNTFTFTLKNGTIQ